MAFRDGGAIETYCRHMATIRASLVFIADRIVDKLTLCWCVFSETAFEFEHALLGLIMFLLLASLLLRCTFLVYDDLLVSPFWSRHVRSANFASFVGCTCCQRGRKLNRGFFRHDAAR